MKLMFLYKMREISRLFSQIHKLFLGLDGDAAGIVQLFFDSKLHIADIAQIFESSESRVHATISQFLTSVLSQTAVIRGFEPGPHLRAMEKATDIRTRGDLVIRGFRVSGSPAERIRETIGAAIRIHTPAPADVLSQVFPRLVHEILRVPLQETVRVAHHKDRKLQASGVSGNPVNQRVSTELLESEAVTGQLDIDQVWEQFHKTHDDYHRNLLMEHYRDIVRYSAERLHAKLPEKVELDDLISAGIFGLMDAIDAFDPERGVRFETYCSARIKGSILDELRSMYWVPRLVRARAHRLLRATNALELHLGRKPTEDEIAKELGLNMADFTRLQKDANAVGQVSLNTKYSDGDGEKDVREIDIIKDERSENPFVEVQKRDLKNLLTKGLTRAERLIIVLYYYEEMTMKEIGATLDLSESRVSQMHSSIIDRLKAQLNLRRTENLAAQREVFGRSASKQPDHAGR